MKKENVFVILLIWKDKSFAYVPERDQHHVVRGKKPSDLFD